VIGVAIMGFRNRTKKLKPVEVYLSFNIEELEKFRKTKVRA